MYTDQVKLNEYVKKINQHFGAEVVEKYYDSRNLKGVPSISGRLEGGLPSITSLMKKIFGDKTTVVQLIGEDAKKVSGKHDSYQVNILPGTGFYFRSLIGSRGALTEKDLTPNKLNLVGKTIKKADIIDHVEAGLIALSNDLPMEILDLGVEISDLAKNKGTTIKVSKHMVKLLQSIPPGDLQKFGKNFGESVLAIWCLYNKPNAESVFFPIEENNALADFVINFTKASKIPSLNVSAKFEGGANASLNSIIPKGAKPPPQATDKEKKAFEAVYAVSYDPIIDGIIRAENILETPHYKALKSLMGGKAVTLPNISAFIEGVFTKCGITQNTDWGSPDGKKKYENFLKALEPFYKAVPGSSGGRPMLSSMGNIAAMKPGKCYHPITYSMTVGLAHIFNNNIEFSSVLDKAATSIKAEQIYLDFNTNNISVKVKEFSKSKFQFAPGAYAYKSDNVRMKVKMLK